MSERILVVEDEANIASFVSAYLEKAGFVVDRAINGAEAKEKAVSADPALILLDLRLRSIGRSSRTGAPGRRRSAALSRRPLSLEGVGNGRRGVRDGTVDAICSDHTPVDEDAKQLPFGESESGATGLELLLALTLKWGEETKIPLAATLAKVTSEPARILGIRAGAIGLGASADVCVFDPHARWNVEPAKLKSQGKNTPFAGYEMSGKVRFTLVEGHVVYEG